MNLSEFEKLWKKLGTTEEGATKCYIIGAIEYVNGNDEGEKMCAMTVPKNRLNDKGLLGPTEKFRITHMKEDPDTPKSYLGGTPENEYKTYSYDNDLVVLENKSKRGEKKSKIFIQSGGKDFPTPVEMRKNKYGYWKLFSTGSIATGVKDIEDDDF